MENRTFSLERQELDLYHMPLWTSSAEAGLDPGLLELFPPAVPTLGAHSLVPLLYI